MVTFALLILCRDWVPLDHRKRNSRSNDRAPTKYAATAKLHSRGKQNPVSGNCLTRHDAPTCICSLDIYGGAFAAFPQPQFAGLLCFSLARRTPALGRLFLTGEATSF
jgi:hypothetical protein